MGAAFEDFNFNRQILNAIAGAGYTEATPIQQKAIPPILNGQDVMGIAQTGTGKTAAYVLPILMKLKFAQGDHARALISSANPRIGDADSRKHKSVCCKYRSAGSCTLWRPWPQNPDRANK